MNRRLHYIIMLLTFISCQNNELNTEWNNLKGENHFAKLLLFASTNLENAYCDSAISHLSDTSINYVTYGIVIKDSIEQKSGLVTKYTDFEYGCLFPLPLYKDRVAFRIQVKENDTILVNNKLCNLNEIKLNLKKFVLNEENLDTLPPKRIEKYKNTNEIEVTIAVVEIYYDLNSMHFDRKYFRIISQLMKDTYDSYADIRNMKSKDLFHKKFGSLNSTEKDIIRTMNPLKLYVHFEEFKDLPPPPPPPSPEDLKKLIIIEDE